MLAGWNDFSIKVPDIVEFPDVVMQHTQELLYINTFLK
jgi:hypothetical protein